MQAGTTRIDVVLNDKSGAAAKRPVAQRIAEFFAARGWQARITVARTAAELLQAAARAAAGDANLVVAGGGDGTIAAVAERLVCAARPMGILPLGTFNYFARRFNVPLDLDAALEVVATGRPTAADVGEVNGHIFLNNASIGLYPTVLQQREKTYGALGRSQVVAYVSVALALLQPPALLNLQIALDGLRVARRTPLLFVGTSELQMESFGVPGYDCIRAGRLAACIVRPLAVVALWSLALRALVRGLHGASELEVACAREVRVALRRSHVRVALDGELRTLSAPLQFRIRQGALLVVAGPESSG